jgi:NADP-dependent 3-hydroxy acid dehydrogenase YdfG
MAAIYPDLAGKVVLVTGGASGIGEAIVRGFARQKSTVIFFDIVDKAGTSLARELSGQGLAAHFANVDVTDIPALRAGIAEACKVHGPIAILINNAAHDERHAAEQVTPEHWDDRIAVNLKHQFFAAQAVLPAMKAARQGVVINFGSTSWMAGQGGMAAYSASKSGVIGLTRSLARDYGPLQYPRERDRTRLDHDRAPARKVADAGKRDRATAPPMPEAEAHAGRDREIHGLPCIRRSVSLHRAALRGGRWLGVNAMRKQARRSPLRRARVRAGWSGHCI